MEMIKGRLGRIVTLSTVLYMNWKQRSIYGIIRKYLSQNKSAACV
jgi:hypothetical protein